MTNNRQHAFIFLEQLQQLGLKNDDVYTKETLHRKYEELIGNTIPNKSSFSYIWYVLVNGNWIYRNGDKIAFGKKELIYTQGTIESLPQNMANNTNDGRSVAYGPMPTWYKLFGQSTEQKAQKSSPSTPAAESARTPSTAVVSSAPVSKPRKRRARKGRVAVDQHLTTAVREDRHTSSNDAVPVVPSLPSGVQVTPGSGGSGYTCQVCRKACSNWQDMKKHVDSRRHHAAMLVSALKLNREQLISNKEGVRVSSAYDQPNGWIDIEIQENEPLVVNLTVTNEGTEEAVSLCCCEMLKKVRVFTLDDTWKVTEGQHVHCMPPGDQYVIKITALARTAGTFIIPIAFTFEHPSTPGIKFHIVRYIRATSTNALMKELVPKVPFKRPPRTALGLPAERVVEGFPLPRDLMIQLDKAIDLDQHFVPAVLRRVINRGLKNTDTQSEADLQYLDMVKKTLAEDLSFENYIERLWLLLHIEEIQMEVDIRRYDMEQATMAVCKSNPRLLVLDVPGVAENRPSVVAGDWLYVREQKADGSGTDIVEYKGYVHQVMASQVQLGFSEKLRNKFLPNMKFSVRFAFNRYPLRLQHRAVQLAEEHSCKQLLFPTPQTIGTCPMMSTENLQLQLYDRQLENNKEQMMAVSNIVAGSARPGPYLLFGPPGTGKTVTLVEAMKQVLKVQAEAHILACAPSNSAADLLTERLLKHVDKAHVLRLNAVSRSWLAVPDAIKGCCNYDRMDSRFFMPGKADLQKYKVITCTLVTAGRIATANFPPGHFSHVFIDECGQALESEALIAVAGVLDSALVNPKGGHLVLAGDPQQLGPVLRSPVAIKHGLGVSLLERLMNIKEVFGPGNPKHLTKLLKNYRSHPAILKLPNEMFYDNELQPCADVLVRESLCRWEGLPKKGFPVVFHGVVGEDMREERSPSFFNPTEVTVVLKHVEELLALRGTKIEEKDIGIISPYRKQVQKLQQVLRKRNLRDIKVGSTEEFQGQERRIIVISTVRSNPDFLTMDLIFKLGFLKNPKRFNVAVTRAKALLIVVGNPGVLIKDACWGKLLRYCSEQGGYTGVDFEEDPEASMEDLIQRFHAVSLNTMGLSGEQGLEITQTEQQEQPAWRSEV